MTRISPAPWKSEGRVVYDANHHFIGYFVIEEGGYDNAKHDNAKHDKANARLAAKAPRMLELLSSLMPGIKEGCKRCRVGKGGCQTCSVKEAEEILKEFGEK